MPIVNPKVARITNKTCFIGDVSLVKLFLVNSELVGMGEKIAVHRFRKRAGNDRSAAIADDDEGTDGSAVVSAVNGAKRTGQHETREGCSQNFLHVSISYSKLRLLSLWRP